MQITADCADVTVAMAFWGAALGYVQEPPPAGYDSWDAYATELGTLDEGGGAWTVRDPEGNEFCGQ